MARHDEKEQSGQRSLQVGVRRKPDPQPWSFGNETLSGRPTKIQEGGLEALFRCSLPYPPP